MSEFFFRYRGTLLAPFGLIILFFGQPSAFSFSAGFLISLAGEAIRFWGVGYAGKSTRKPILEAPELVTAGPYARVRHPLYIGNLLMGMGGMIMAVGNAGAAMSFLFFFVFLFSYGTVYGAIIPLEENFLRRQFGEEYESYRKRIPRILPAIKPYGSPSGAFSWKRAATTEYHTIIPYLIIVLVMGLKIR